MMNQKQEMRKIGEKIKKEIPGLGFCLLVFEFHKPGISNYLSNAQRADMILSLKETVKRLVPPVAKKNKQGIKIEIMTVKRKLKIINAHLKSARKELQIAKESLGMGYDASFRKMRKDWYEEWELIVFCLENAKNILSNSNPIK